MSNIHYDFNNQDANREYPIKPKDAYDIKKAKEKIEEEQALQKKAVEFSTIIHQNWEKMIEKRNPPTLLTHKYRKVIKDTNTKSVAKREAEFKKEVLETSKYYNAKILSEDDNVVPKKLKATTINDKTITYTHCIPSSIDLVEFTLKQRLKILLGIKVNATINTYLKDGRIEITILKINE